MKKYVLLFSIIILFTGCVSTKIEFNYNVGGCPEQEQMQIRSAFEMEEEAGESIEITSSINSIAINQKLTYVCCAEIKLSLEQEENILKIIEENVGEVCRCICDYDIDATISNLDLGVYRVQIYGVKYEDTQPELLAEKEVYVGKECSTDEDCVSATCCHPTKCVNMNLKPDCTDIACTMECKPNTLDCGGKCICENNKCEAIYP